jgi:hypothetical protein
MANEVTRAELYQLVWTIPMSRLASEFGVTDVALAKTCKRWNIPRPGRGYWAQLEAGQQLERPPLSKSPAHDQIVTSRRPHDASSSAAPVTVAAPGPRVIAPAVPLPKDLKDSTDAVRELGKRLGTAMRDPYGRLVVGSMDDPVLAVTVATHRRALALLEALFRALNARGHASALVEHSEGVELVVMIGGQHHFPVSLIERLDQKGHVLTPAEKERAAKGSTYRIPKYDSFAGGRLQLKLVTGEYSRRSWSDSSTRRLEKTLGSVILALEFEVEARRQEELAAEQRRRQEELAAEQRRREELEAERQREEERLRAREREAQRKHQEALAKDLRAKASAWAEAQGNRSGMDAFADGRGPAMV